MSTLEHEAVDGNEEIEEAPAVPKATAAEAREWLADRLAGGEAPSAALAQDAAAFGITDGQLRHARERLGVAATQRSRQWWWLLPEPVDETIPPPVANAPARFRRDWLPSTDIVWIEALRVATSKPLTGGRGLHTSRLP